MRVMFDVILTALPFVQAGRLRALAVTTRGRAPVLPAIAEPGYPGYEATTWFGVAAPQATPEPIRARLRDALGAVQADASFDAGFGSLGLLVQPPRDEAALTEMLEAAACRWSGVIQARGIALD